MRLIALMVLLYSVTMIDLGRALSQSMVVGGVYSSYNCIMM